VLPGREVTRAALVFAVVAAGLATADGARAAALAPFSQSYVDTPGDAAGCFCPDVTEVTVANDAAGVLTFTVKLANQPVLQPTEVMAIGLDTDSTLASGGASGADRLVLFHADGRVELWRWSDGRYVKRAARSLTAAFADGVGTIVASARALGAPPVFRFYVAVRGLTVAEDRAPADAASWRYVVGGTPPPPAPRIVKVVSGPAWLSAHGDLRMEVAVARTDTNGPVERGTTRCTASTVHGLIAAFWVEPLRHGFASCTWLLPRTSAGQRIRATIQVNAFGQTASRTIVRRVRRFG
jgi:hypothetical protein